jgi:hypothetical protein
MDTDAERTRFPVHLLKGALYCLWQVIRLPALAVLVILEPIIGTLLVGLALLGSLIAFVFEFATTVPNFPFWGMLTISLGCLGLLGLYHALIRILSMR